MKLGLITDIHEHVVNLRRALDQFDREQVDQIVFIGDLFELGQRVEETCQLMNEANVVGVWGNHDYGLSFRPDAVLRDKFSSSVFDYMGTLCPRLAIAGCYFSHVEPWLNPEEIVDLWFFDGPPDNPDRLEKIFNSVPERIMFAGHYHEWLVVSPDGISDWKGDRPLSLAEGRHFVVVDALCKGSFATYDTECALFSPYRVEK